MTDQKKQPKSGPLELSEEELSKAGGGGIVLLPVGSVKQRKSEAAGVWIEFEQGDVSKP